MDPELIQKKILFPLFLDNHKEYEKLEAWWETVFHELFSARDIPFQAPFYKHQFADGTKLYDGNPIYDAYFPGQHKLVRIVQELPEEPETPHLSGYFDMWPIAEVEDELKPTPADPAKFEQPIPELVLFPLLTPEVIHQIKDILIDWIVHDRSKAELIATWPVLSSGE